MTRILVDSIFLHDQIDLTSIKGCDSHSSEDSWDVINPGFMARCHQ